MESQAVDVTLVKSGHLDILRDCLRVDLVKMKCSRAEVRKVYNICASASFAIRCVFR